jgi:hypothetical protein
MNSLELRAQRLWTKKSLSAFGPGVTEMKPHYVAKPCTGGFRLYTRGGLFGALTFSRYLWSTP